MTYSFRYGTKDLDVELPGDRIDVFSSAEIALSDPSTLVFNAIDNSVPSLEDFLGDSSSVVIVVSDHTRNT
ncbi:MAG: lactate racemase domain-containing protein, partial [Spirochaetota bacterium]